MSCSYTLAGVGGGNWVQKEIKTSISLLTLNIELNENLENTTRMYITSQLQTML